MDPLMDVIKNSDEPEWLEKDVVGGLRFWQVMFLSFAAVTTLIVMVCCCFRFRIPRTKQQIEADSQRRKITTKFRRRLESIQDSRMDAMSLNDAYRHRQPVTARVLCMLQALELLHEKKTQMADQPASQHSSMVSPQQSSLDAPAGQQQPAPQVSALSFARFATKVAHLSKLGAPKSPTSPTPSSGNKIDF